MDAQFRILPDVRATTEDADGSVLLNLASGRMFTLNGTGAKVWTMLEQGFGFEAVVDSLMQENGMPRQQVQGDVEIFLRALENKGLVRMARS
jgi:hypothetical protein